MSSNVAGRIVTAVHGVRKAADDPAFYAPMSQFPFPSAVVVVSMSGSDPLAVERAIRAEMRKLNPSMAVDFELASDVVQNTFLAIWTQARTFDSSRGQPSTWILTMTHHKAVDMVRREERRRAEPLDDAPAAADPEPAVEHQAWLGVAREQIAAALARLPDPHREVIELAYFAGYTQSELAERLAVPIGTVKSRTFAAMNALREALAALGMRPEDEWNTSTS